MRSTEFVKRLPGYGWDPVVLTVAQEAYDGFPIDHARLAEIPDGTVIHRAPGKCADEKFKLLYKLRLNRLVRYVYCPDHEIYETPQSLRLGKSLLRCGGFEAIYSTSGPRSSHLIAMLLKKRTGLPWVADFRDPWDCSNELPYASRFHADLSHALERRVAARADALVANTPAAGEDLRRKFGAMASHKVHVITNGYNEDEFRSSPDLSALSKTGLVRFVSVGSVYGDYPGDVDVRDIKTEFPLGYFRAIAAVMSSEPDLRERLRFVFVGSIDRSAVRALEDLRISDVVEIVGTVPKKEASSRMLTASINVLLTGNYCPPHVVRARTYEMLRAGRPILAITPDGDNSRLLRSVGGASIADPFDVESIASCISSMASRLANGALEGPEIGAVRSYDREVLTAELAAILDACCSGDKVD